MKMHRVKLKPKNKDCFEVIEAYAYKGKIVVPKGYITNGADIPRLLWSIFPPNSPEYLTAVVIHDCAIDFVKHKKYGYTFKKADDLFLEVMLEIGVSNWKAKLFYYSCRLYHKLKGDK